MTAPRTTLAVRRQRAAGLAALAILSLGATACSADDDGVTSSGESSGSSVAADDSAAQRAVPAEAEAGAGDAVTDSSFADSDAEVEAQAPAPAEQAAEPTGARSLISTGTVALRSADVGQARFDVRQIVDAYGGEVSADDTETDRQGEALRSRLVLRIPSGDFTAAMEELEQVAGLVRTTTSVEDVTTQVIDTDVRVRLQRRSIERIELLLDRAASIRDIVAIEGQLSRREANLGSLEQRQAFLADQTGMSTITVSVARPPAAEDEPRDEADEQGFLSGLERGWSGLVALTLGLLTVGGAVLPFAVVVLLLALVLRPVVRRVRRRLADSAAPTPSEA